MGYIAVIDTETNWWDQVMSIGVVLADQETMTAADAGYYILEPECEIGGMYEGVLDLVREQDTLRCTREDAMEQIRTWLGKAQTEGIFAYNARFDFHHLPELNGFSWYDIMRIAAYRQHNPFIPADADCCTTGRLKRQYGVEPITRLLTGDWSYRETHNALYDAMDELRIMRLLPLTREKYPAAKI